MQFVEADAAGEPGAMRIRAVLVIEHTYGYGGLGLRRRFHAPRFRAPDPVHQVSDPYAQSAYGREG
ncbi:hypothetical protein GCM10010231_18560 [Streptomyces sindenensis]|nr:hypothetical protein GCM10010231_18560 [Streptomyces sindenensis]